jgi:hypothetical protein
MQKTTASVATCPPRSDSALGGSERPDEIRASRGEDPAQQRLFERLVRTESRFLLDNDLSLIPSLVGHLRDNLAGCNLCDEPRLIRMSIALDDALKKAIVRGNLEIDPCLREADPRAFQTLIEQRRREKPYRDRRVHIFAKELLHEARYVIRHEGPGFYVANPLAADDPRMFELVSVRGMVLIQTFMDEVSHDDTGNGVTLVKGRDPGDITLINTGEVYRDSVVGGQH